MKIVYTYTERTITYEYLLSRWEDGYTRQELLYIRLLMHLMPFNIFFLFLSVTLQSIYLIYMLWLGTISISSFSTWLFHYLILAIESLSFSLPFPTLSSISIFKIVSIRS